MLATLVSGPRLVAGPARPAVARDAPTPTPSAVPPAEDWVRTPLVQVDFTADQPMKQDVLLMGGSAVDMRSTRDVRSRFTDFRPLGTGASTNLVPSQSYDDALVAAAAFSKQLNSSFAWLKNPAVAVMCGRDHWFWAVPLRVGNGSEAVASDDARVPSLDDHMGAQFAVTNWQEGVVAVVSGDRYIDTRLDINGSPGSLAVQAVPAPPITPPAGA